MSVFMYVVKCVMTRRKTSQTNKVSFVISSSSLLFFFLLLFPVIFNHRHIVHLYIVGVSCLKWEWVMMLKWVNSRHQSSGHQLDSCQEMFLIRRTRIRVKECVLIWLEREREMEMKWWKMKWRMDHRESWRRTMMMIGSYLLLVRVTFFSFFLDFLCSFTLLALLSCFYQ